jgi:hypothetical protein
MKAKGREVHPDAPSEEDRDLGDEGHAGAQLTQENLHVACYVEEPPKLEGV